MAIDSRLLLARAIVPHWDAPAHIGALSTTRQGGVSVGAWGLHGGAGGGLNLGDACGDDGAAVARNRARLAYALGAMPVWLDQVHGKVVHRLTAADRDAGVALRDEKRRVAADASITDIPGVVLAVLTADCLPVLLTDDGGRVVAAVHAGWRGLSAGVLENAVTAMRALLPAQARLQAWLGPSIGPAAFEVGDEVRGAFGAPGAGCASAFRPGQRPGKWLADLPMLARLRLEAVGVRRIHGSDRCTVRDADDFYSWRRDRTCGRMATLVWIRPR